MGLFSFLRRKKWEELGQSVPSNILYKEMWSMGSSIVELKDSTFQSIEHKDFMEIYNRYCASIPRWAKDIWDCDNIAINRVAAVQFGWKDLSRGKLPLCFGYAEAMIPAGWHAFLWHRDPAGIYRFIEPQTDKALAHNILEFREFWAC